MIKTRDFKAEAYASAFLQCVWSKVFGKETNDMTKKQFVRMYKFVSRFSQRFNGKVDCRDLLEEKDLLPVPEVAELGATKHCETLIISAVAMLYDYLEELDKE